MLGSLERLESVSSIDIEIGGGTGQFAVQYASENPNRVFVSIERTVNKFVRFAARLASFHPENLIACHTNGISWLTHQLGNKKIDRCFFMYPNPEPKNPNQRWIRSPFFGHLLSRLSDEGEIFFASNLASYIEEVEQISRASWGLSVARKSIVTAQPRTAFESKYLSSGQTCYEIVLRKARSSH